jgi:hypothetical protein
VLAAYKTFAVSFCMSFGVVVDWSIFSFRHKYAPGGPRTFHLLEGNLVYAEQHKFNTPTRILTTSIKPTFISDAPLIVESKNGSRYRILGAPNEYYLKWVKKHGIDTTNTTNIVKWQMTL